MAPKNRDVSNPAPGNRLGCWWRAWIVLTVVAAVLMFAYEIYNSAWRWLGIVLFFLIPFGYSAVALAVGLAVSWVLKGRKQ